MTGLKDGHRLGIGVHDGRGHHVGTLEPGKFADFAILEKDFFTVPVDEILDMQVIATGLNGEFVYDLYQIGSGN